MECERQRWQSGTPWETEAVGEMEVGVDRIDKQQQSAPGRAQDDELKQGSSQGGQGGRWPCGAGVLDNAG